MSTDLTNFLRSQTNIKQQAASRGDNSQSPENTLKQYAESQISRTGKANAGSTYHRPNISYQAPQIYAMSRGKNRVKSSLNRPTRYPREEKLYGAF